MKYKKYKEDIISQVMRDLSKGYSKKGLSEKYNIPRATIQYWAKYKIENTSSNQSIKTIVKNKDLYSYILGLYLGDGYIYKIKNKKNLYRLSIFQDKRYTELISFIKKRLKSLFGNCCSINCKGCVSLTVYKSNLTYYFPQHGSGKKHLRKIELTPFQKSSINKIELMRGLFHSDGTFFTRKVGNYHYENYSFTNKSSDLILMFSDCLESQGIGFKKRIRKNGVQDIMIQKRVEVEKLKSLIGTKTEF